MEEKPFKRITKRLLNPDSVVSIPPTLPLTPPPDGSAADEAAAAHELQKQQQFEERQQWREDVLLDFAAFESSIVRIQFLLTSNIKERERYAAEKLKIQATAQAVRDNTADLRLQLEEAQKTLRLRKEYDELAEKITSNRLLKPREDQQANLQKLHAEISELERESQEYAQTWAERRQQFGKIIDEGMQLRRLIRDEKEEVERREGMEDREDAEEGEAASQKGADSGFATPGHGDREATPLVLVSQEQEEEPASGLTTTDRASAPRGKSPLRHMQVTDESTFSGSSADDNHPDDAPVVGDIDMAEDGELSGENDTVAAPPEGLATEDVSGDGERNPEHEHDHEHGGSQEQKTDRMDTS